MRVRALDANYDMQFGQSQADFISNSPATVGQVILTRMNMWQGQWFLNTADGTPYTTRVFGKYTNNTRDPAMKARVLATQGVTGLGRYASQIDRNKRSYSVQASVDTLYGNTPVVIPISAPAIDVTQGR